MTRLENFGQLDSAPRWILLITGSHVAFGALALYAWHVLSETLSMRVSWTGAGGASAAGMAVLQAGLCALVLRSFPQGAALRPAWLLIMLSAIFRAAALEALPMALLAGGLFAALRTMRKFGFCERPRPVDWALTGAVGAFAVWRAIEPAGLIATAASVFLCVLVFEALALRRAAARMNGGMIGRCWSLLSVAILVTAAGEIAGWAARSFLLDWPVAALEWSAWFVAAIDFALSPAYQLAAGHRAARQ
ncbi:MAG: hypothetical protein ACM336_01315 [Acidobacteriota bacterium]